MSSEPPVIDYRAYPHLFDRVMAHVAWDALPALRLTGKAVGEQANAVLWRHVVLRVEEPGHIDILDPFRHRRIPGLRFECAAERGPLVEAHDEVLLYRTLDRLRTHTRTVDHWLHDSESYATDDKPPRWHGNVREALEGALHRIDVSENDLPFLSQEAERVVLRYRPFEEPSEGEEEGHRMNWPVGFGTKRIVARLHLPTGLVLTDDDWSALWQGVIGCRDYLPPGCEDVAVIITQGNGDAPPQFTEFTPSEDDTEPWFSFFMSILCGLGARSIAVVGLETVDPGVFGLLDAGELAEERLALYKAVIDNWVMQPGSLLNVPDIEVVTVGGYRAAQGLDAYEWSLLAAAPGARLPLPSRWPLLRLPPPALQ
ncbi:hypothetical protein Q8F55_009224 [Vanrija albida]|uniref:Uncharacterized protein n=1 Tax=Vanrija albida TaxID=181172 RepID=A0ABR3PT21_9TREE